MSPGEFGLHILASASGFGIGVGIWWAVVGILRAHRKHA